MPETIPQQDVAAALKRLEKKDPGLKRLLNKAYGYAVFPSVGKAAAVVGGAFGRGKLYERGKFIGHATLSQLTLGVQLGGDTFTEVIVFESRQALERFKQGKTAFAASASAVLVKAGAAAANNFNRGVAVFAYSEGGMLLELSLGGQRFKFKPAGQQEQQQGGGKAGKAQQGKGQGKDQAEAEDSGEEQDQDEGEEGEQDEQGEGEGDDDESSLGLVRRAFGGVRGAASSVGSMAKEHPLAASLLGAGVAAGLVFMITRAVRRAGASSDEGSQEEGSQEEEGSDEDEGAQDQSDSGEEEDESQNSDQDDEQEDRFLRRGRARA